MSVGQKVVHLKTENSQFWTVYDFGPDLWSQLKNIELLEEPEVTVFGKRVRQRRDVGFFSDTSIGYHYAGQLAASIPLSTLPCLAESLARVNDYLGTKFNGILINRYRNGEKYIGAHSDDESALDPEQKIVAGICYGPAVRNFRLRHKDTKKIALNHPHQPNSLLVMEGEFQQEFTHEIPKEKRIKEERISLTFRHHLK